jgi:pyridoxal phosphate enzyme (YggS family)
VSKGYSTNQQELLAENISYVRATIEQAARSVGRDPADIVLIAVSKTKPLALVKIAYDLGITNFGENRVQEALLKIAEFHPSNLCWHMIGHLQSNKVNKVVGAFDTVQSVDSLYLAEALNRSAASLNQRLPVLLEVNVAAESSKAGMPLAEVPALAQQIVTLSYLDVQGLMTVAPLVDDPEQVRPVFRTLRDLREQLRAQIPQSSWQHLSMGMTDDYTIAIQEGATIIRVGRAIFGERTQK